MIWYQTGTISVANGSTIVTGAGTAFNDNVAPGAGFITTDGRTYPVAAVNSDGQLTLEVPYQGGNIAGAAYSILPTQAYDLVLARRVLELTNSFSDVRDGVGQGMFPDGTVAAPGVRFASDQDTGIRRATSNTLQIVTGGQVAADFSIGITSFPNILSAGGLITANGTNRNVFLGSASNYGYTLSSVGDDFHIYDAQNPALVRFAITYSGGNGRIGIGTTTPAAKLQVEAATGALALGLGVANYALTVHSVNGTAASASATCLRAAADGATGRSINAGGTINASGADYAEYMRKSEACGTIAKGDVCGVDADGKLTKTWADSISFVVKSTDPSLVGGDVWGSDMPAKPEAPTEPAAPVEPLPVPPIGTAPTQPVRGDNENDEAFVARLGEFFATSAAYVEQIAATEAYTQARASYEQQLATHQAAHTQWQADQAQYEADLAEWEAALEAARKCVDRIAFSGQVPCNVTGDFAVGDYIVAAANGGGIKAIAVPEADMTLPLYMKRIGKVWAVTDGGRAWIDVQHG